MMLRDDGLAVSFGILRGYRLHADCALAIGMLSAFCQYTTRSVRIMHVQGTPMKKIVKYAAGRGFTDVAVFNENQKHVNGLLLIHLPAGPTAHFKLSSLKLSKDIKVGSCSSICPDVLPMLPSATLQLSM